MSTGEPVEPVDTIESLQKQMKSLKEDIFKREHKVYERAERHSGMDMVDKYVLALLPALVAKHTNPFELAQDAFNIADILTDHRDDYMEGD